MFLHPRYAWIRQLAAFAVLLAVWEAAGRAGLLNPLYVPNPSRIGAALLNYSQTVASGRISTQPSPLRLAVSHSASSSAFCSGSLRPLSA